MVRSLLMQSSSMVPNDVDGFLDVLSYFSFLVCTLSISISGCDESLNIAVPYAGYVTTLIASSPLLSSHSAKRIPPSLRLTTKSMSLISCSIIRSLTAPPTQNTWFSNSVPLMMSLIRFIRL